MTTRETGELVNQDISDNDFRVIINNIHIRLGCGVLYFNLEVATVPQRSGRTGL